MLSEREYGKLVEELSRLRLYKPREYADKLAMLYTYFKLSGNEIMAANLYHEVRASWRYMRECFKPLIDEDVKWDEQRDPLEAILCIASRKAKNMKIPSLMAAYFYLRNRRMSLEKYGWIVLWLRLTYSRKIDEEFMGDRMLTVEDILSGGGLKWE